MSSKFSISTVAIAAILTLSYSAIAAAEAYKTSKGQVVVTGLTAKQKYQIKGITSQNKPTTRKDFKDFAANPCGEAVIDRAAKYKSLIVGTETIDPATLNTKEHPKCKPAKTASASKRTPKKVPTATSTTTTPAAGSTGTTGTTAPATGMPATGTTTTPTTAPAAK